MGVAFFVFCCGAWSSLSLGMWGLRPLLYRYRENGMSKSVFHAAILFMLLSAHAEMRTWRDSQNRVISAEIIGITDHAVYLRREGGRQGSIQLESLSDWDRQVVQSLGSAEKKQLLIKGAYLRAEEIQDGHKKLPYANVQIIKKHSDTYARCQIYHFGVRDLISDVMDNSIAYHNVGETFLASLWWSGKSDGGSRIYMPSKEEAIERIIKLNNLLVMDSPTFQQRGFIPDNPSSSEPAPSTARHVGTEEKSALRTFLVNGMVGLIVALILIAFSLLKKMVSQTNEKNKEGTSLAYRVGRFFARTKQGITTSTILTLIASAMLFGCLADNLPYSYFQFLRWVVCGVCGFRAFVALEQEKVVWMWIFFPATVLFNPIVPIHLDRDIWVVIDVVLAVVLLISLVAVKARKEAR